MHAWLRQQLRQPNTATYRLTRQRLVPRHPRRVLQLLHQLVQPPRRPAAHPASASSQSFVLSSFYYSAGSSRSTLQSVPPDKVSTRQAHLMMEPSKISVMPHTSPKEAPLLQAKMTSMRKGRKLLMYSSAGGREE